MLIELRGMVAARYLLCASGIEKELFREMSDLRDSKHEMEKAVPTGRRTYQLLRWFEKVNTLDREVFKLEIVCSNGGKTPSFQRCSYWSMNYKLRKEVRTKLKRAIQLVKERKEMASIFLKLKPPTTDPVEEVGCLSPLVGRERLVSSVLFQIRRTYGPKIIVVHGVSGVGKTVLLERVCENLTAEEFDVVVRVTVGKVGCSSRIREEIGAELGYARTDEQKGGRRLPADELDAARELRDALNSNRFLLVLDDVHEKLNLRKIGVPDLDDWCTGKVVITTRFLRVSEQMRALPIRVDCLDNHGSMALFCRQLGDGVDAMKKQAIGRHIKSVVRKCSGLPIALVVGGSALAGEASNDRWKEALKSLKKVQAEASKGELKEARKRLKKLQGDSSHGRFEPYPILRFSYDGLDAAMKDCLLYCVLFPENHEILPERLVEYWVGEGLLDDVEDDRDREISIDDARERGHGVVSRLQTARLLEAASCDDGKKSVRMHSVVRELALTVTDGARGKKKHELFLANAGQGLKTMRVDLWGTAKRVSVMLNHIAEVPQPPSECTELVTLMLNDNIDITGLPGDLFVYTPRLRVLDMSNTSLQKIPRAIGVLRQLQYLNLSFTFVESVPEELGNLGNLRRLDLSLTFALDSVPQKAISGLSSLESLNLAGSGYQWRSGEGSSSSQDQMISFDDLDRMERLKEIGLRITEASAFQSLMLSKRSLDSTRFLELEVAEGLDSGDLSAVFERSKALQELDIRGLLQVKELRLTVDTQWRNLEALRLSELSTERILTTTNATTQHFPVLASIDIRHCHKLKDLSWVSELPQVEQIDVAHCRDLEILVAVTARTELECEIQPADVEDGLFPKLRRMTLSRLPKLGSISCEPLQFPSLETMAVDDCPELKDLSINGDGCPKLRWVRGHPTWWNRLIWRDAGVKRRLGPCVRHPCL